MTSQNREHEAGELISDEEMREYCDSLLRHFMPQILLALLAQQKIDKNRIGDRGYVWSVVKENSDIIDDMKAIHIIDDQFTESAKVAAATGNIFAAVVLIAISVEHKLNIFYRTILEFSSNLNTDEATQAIRNNNADSKIGWFFLLVSGRELSEELKKRIRQVYPVVSR